MQWGKAEQIATWLWQVVMAATGNQATPKHRAILPGIQPDRAHGRRSSVGSEGGSFWRSPCSGKRFVAPPSLLFRPQPHPLNSDTSCPSFFPQTTGLRALQALSPDQPCLFSAPPGWPSLCGVCCQPLTLELQPPHF